MSYFILMIKSGVKMSNPFKRATHSIRKGEIQKSLVFNRGNFEPNNL